MEKPDLPTHAAARLGTGADAARAALAPLGWSEGARLGLVGDSGCGKSRQLAGLVAEYLRVSSGLALIVDDSTTTPFVGQVRGTPADLVKQPPAAEPRALIFRGDVGRGVRVEAEPVAQLAWTLARRRPRVPPLLVIDELSRAAKGQNWIGGPNCGVASAMAEGRKAELSVVWATQSPQSVPREAIEQAPRLWVSHLAGRGLAYLVKLYDLPADVEREISALPDAESPPNVRGAFIVVRRGGGWDGVRRRF